MVLGEPVGSATAKSTCQEWTDKFTAWIYTQENGCGTLQLAVAGLKLATVIGLLISASFFGGAPNTGGLRIYAVGGHTHLQPMFRGAQLYAVDGNNGSLLWSIDGWFQAGGPVGADGYMVGIDGYTNELTCFGKGNTKTTVDAPMTGVTVGNNVVLRGTVTDQSPGKTCLGMPTAGTPAVSDASMSQWMEYL